MNNIKIQIITHYDKNDKDFSCDYYSVDVKVRNKIVRHYSDSYHDRGKEKADGFVDGWLFANGQNIDIEKSNPLVLRSNRADGKT